MFTNEECLIMVLLLLCKALCVWSVILLLVYYYNRNVYHKQVAMAI